MVRNAAGEEEVVVIGGQGVTGTLDVVEIFSVKDRTWREGPDCMQAQFVCIRSTPTAKPLPSPMMYTTTVQFGDTFLLVGGATETKLDVLDTIYKYEASTEKWIRMRAELSESKCWVAAALVDWPMIQFM